MRNQMMTRNSDPLWNLLFGDFNPKESVPQHTPYDVKETEDRYLLAMDLPGIRNEDLKVDLLGKTLTISGQRKSIHGDATEAKKFNFQFTLPDRANLAALEAKLEDGVLQVTLPKREEEKPRAIQVLGSKAN